jgi:hypothetical protein
MAEALRLAGRWSEAREAYTRLSAAEPDDIVYQGKVGAMAAREGDAAAAREIRQTLEQLDRPFMRGDNMFWCACISAVLGEQERAIAYLHDAVQQGLGFRDVIKAEIAFESLHDHPAFRELLTPQG